MNPKPRSSATPRPRKARTIAGGAKSAPAAKPQPEQTEAVPTDGASGVRAKARAGKSSPVLPEPAPKKSASRKVLKAPESLKTAAAKKPGTPPAIPVPPAEKPTGAAAQATHSPKTQDAPSAAPTIGPVTHASPEAHTRAESAPDQKENVQAFPTWPRFKETPDASLDALCDYIVAGGHLNGFCKERGYSYTSALRWLNGDPARSEMYARAREDRSDTLAEEIVEISDAAENDTYVDAQGNTRTDHEVVARSKLRVDARKWVASKLKPRVYGDKVQLDGSLNTATLTDDQLLAQLAKYGIQAKIGAPAPEGGDAA